MNRLILMVGAPGSGKSTYIRNHKEFFGGNDSLAIVSRDDIRFKLVKEDEEYFSKEKEVFEEFVNTIKKYLKMYDEMTVVADATHISQASRTKLLRAIGKDLKNVEVWALIMDTPLDIKLAQNENRKDTRAYVPKSVIRRMSAQYEPPRFEEGFNVIATVRRKEY